MQRGASETKFRRIGPRSPRPFFTMTEFGHNSSLCESRKFTVSSSAELEEQRSLTLTMVIIQLRRRLTRPITNIAALALTPLICLFVDTPIHLQPLPAHLNNIGLQGSRIYTDRSRAILVPTSCFKMLLQRLLHLLESLIIGTTSPIPLLNLSCRSSTL